MASPMIVFVSTCKGRVQHLSETLPQNIADNIDYPNCKFVVLDYCDPGPLRKYLWENHRQDMHSGKLVVYHHFGAPVVSSDTYPEYMECVLSNRTIPLDISFHMAHAKNMAARCGILEGADIYVTLDADNYTGPGFAKYIAETLQPGGFLCPDFPTIHAMPHGPDRPARGYAGRLAIRAHDFIKMGGYDETFDTWRGEDMDMLFRLRRAGYQEQHIDNRFLNAVRHNAEIRFKEYPHAKVYEEPDVSEAYIQSLAAKTVTVVNEGIIGIGDVYRNFKPTPITLGFLPTRIFGIGMHRTATSSLSKAFQILGYDSFHFNTGNEARMIWEEMNINGSSKTLEKWYALCDLPIPLLYEQLDKAYPGSKFILTVRDEKAWLTSVRRLWDARFNPNRWTWDIYPFTNRIHKALYGRTDFDGPTMLQRYRKHNADVLEYFENRRNHPFVDDDLLVMDMDDDAGWEELCEFLNVPVPEVPYPFVNPSPAMSAETIDEELSVTNPREYCEWIGAMKTIVEWGMFEPNNPYTRALLENWRIIDERWPEPGDTWIEEDSYGAGIMRSFAYNGQDASPLPVSRRLIVEPRPIVETSSSSTQTFSGVMALARGHWNWRKIRLIAALIIVFLVVVFSVWKEISK